MPFLLTPKHDNIPHRWAEQLALWKEQRELYYSNHGHNPYPQSKSESEWMLAQFPLHFATRAEAHKLKAVDETIVFVATDDETETWHTREQYRFHTGLYIATPWQNWEQHPNHFAHLSTKQPGLIAYTKDDEHGIADRQTTTKPGRYLSQFYPDRFSKTDVARFIGQCGATCNTLQIATTAADIKAVYIGGPGSCMGGDGDGRTFRTWTHHPTEVYAGPDLAVAYYGPIDAACARSVIWPDKKLWSRLYGNEAVLKAMLADAGYRYGDPIGARIRKVRHANGGYMLPYIDGIDSCSDHDDYFLLDNSGDHCCQRTSGDHVTIVRNGYDEPDEDEDDTTASCAGCSRAYDTEDDNAYDGYCPRCSENRGSCNACGDSFDYDDLHSINDDSYCLRCTNSRFRRTCAVASCDARWVEELDFDEDDQTRREDNHLDTFCSTCEDDYRWCDRCSTLTDLTAETAEDAYDPMQTCVTCGHAWRCADTPALPAVDLQAVLDNLLVYPFSACNNGFGTTRNPRICGAQYNAARQICCRLDNHGGPCASIGEVLEALGRPHGVSARGIDNNIYLPLPIDIRNAGILPTHNLTYTPIVLQATTPEGVV